MILRDVNAAAQEEYDLVVIGGGIYGACMLLEAAKRGLKALLIERDDFGGATSWNSLRIIHGGLRYLQSVNLKRYFESVGERRWFLNTFPGLVKPLPCLMPLYDEGLKRVSVLRAALRINEWLGASRGLNRNDWEPGRVVSGVDALDLAPCIPMRGLAGAALWYDAALVSPQRVLIGIIKRACSGGAAALNYVEAHDLVARGDAVSAVRAVDRTTGQKHDFATRAIANCAGPWSRQVAAALDRDEASLFRPSLAFNLLLDREPLSSCALAISSRQQDAGKKQVYFLYPIHGRVIAGTFHAPWQGGPEQPRPSHEQVLGMLEELNAAVPGLDAGDEDVLRVYSGLLPARRAATGAIATRNVICEHGRTGGPRGMISVSGVKFTTARRVAQQAIGILFPKARVDGGALSAAAPVSAGDLNILDPESPFNLGDEIVAREIERIVREEAVVTIDDLLLRRTDWLVDPRDTQRITERVQSLMPALGRRIAHDQRVAASPPLQTAHSAGGR